MELKNKCAIFVVPNFRKVFNKYLGEELCYKKLMENIFNTLKNKKLQLFFCFYILLTLPLLCLMADNLTLAHASFMILVNSALFLSILVLALFFSSRVEKTVYTCLFIITLVPTAILLAYLLFAHVLLQADSIISLFETNSEESKEFLAYYLSPWVILGVLIYIFIPIVMIYKMKRIKKLNVNKYRSSFISALVMLLAILSIPKLSQAVPFIHFYHIFTSYKIRVAHEYEAIDLRQTIPYDVHIDKVDTLPQTMIIVIGESLSKRHMSLYGYGRNTNPLLSKEKSLYTYTNVISPQAHTIPVMRSVLTLEDSIHDDYLTQNPSLFELFNRAGFETYLLSNQGFTGNSKTSYSVFLNLAKHQYDLSNLKSDDGIIFKTLSQILSDPTPKNRLIVIHLMGNHMAYEFRYPSTYEHFENAKDDFIHTTAFRNKKAIMAMDRYDNSVLFNDFVVDSIIHSIQNKPQASMIYFSDHGEEVYDKRNFAGHAYEKVTDYMCEVPFIVWLSSDFQKKNCVFNIDRPYSTKDVLYSISELAGLHYKDYDPTKSIFSSSFTPRTRYVGHKTYEEVKQQKYSSLQSTN